MIGGGGGGLGGVYEGEDEQFDGCVGVMSVVGHVEPLCISVEECAHAA